MGLCAKPNDESIVSDMILMILNRKRISKAGSRHDLWVKRCVVRLVVASIVLFALVGCLGKPKKEVERYNKLFEEYHVKAIYGDKSTIYDDVNSMLKLAEEENSHYGKVLAHLDLAFFAAQDGQFEKMYKEVEIARASLDVNDNDFLKGYIYYVEGVINYNTDNTINALQSYNKAIHYFEDLGDSAMMTRTYLNKYSYYIVKGDYAQAKESLNKAMQWCTPVYKDIATLYDAILDSYNSDVDHKPNSYRAWLQTTTRSNGLMSDVTQANIRYWIYFYNNYIRAFVQSGNLDSAEYYCNQSIQLANTYGSKFEQQMARANSAWMLQLSGRYDEAISICREISESFDGLYAKGLKKTCYRQEMECHLLQNNYKEAFFCQQKIAELDDVDDTVIHLSERFLDSQREYEREILRLEKRHTQYRILLVIAAFVLLLIGALSVVLSLRRRLNRQAEHLEQIRQENLMIEQQKKLEHMKLEHAATREQLASVSQQIKSIASEMPKNIRARLIQSIDPLEENEGKWSWDDFEQGFVRNYEGFVNRLSEMYPSLSPLEVKICMLIKVELSNKEIALTLHLADNTIRTYRARIRKKMQLTSDVDTLNQYIENYL